MESTNFPIIIKKRNGVMLGVSILEIILGIIFAATGDGIKSILLWIFVFAGVVTALSVLVEYSQDIILKENKMEFYKLNDLIETIKYSSINSIYVSKGNEPKNKRKDFLAISFSENDKKKSKNLKKDVYLINFMHYSSKDLAKIRDMVMKKNPSVKIEEGVEKYLK